MRHTVQSELRSQRGILVNWWPEEVPVWALYSQHLAPPKHVWFCCSTWISYLLQTCTHQGLRMVWRNFSRCSSCSLLTARSGAPLRLFASVRLDSFCTNTSPFLPDTLDYSARAYSLFTITHARCQFLYDYLPQIHVFPFTTSSTLLTL